MSGLISWKFLYTQLMVKEFLRSIVLLGDDGVLKGLSADEAFEGHVLLVTAHLVVLIIYIQTTHY